MRDEARADCGQVAKRPELLQCDGPGAAGLRRSYHQIHTVTISASRPIRTKALGLNTAARISELGLNAPQVGQRITPARTVAAQRLQTSLGKKQTPVGGKPSPGRLVG